MPNRFRNLSTMLLLTLCFSVGPKSRQPSVHFQRIQILCSWKTSAPIEEDRAFTLFELEAEKERFRMVFEFGTPLNGEEPCVVQIDESVGQQQIASRHRISSPKLIHIESGV